MSEVIITVRGEHETRLAPEEGVAHISLTAEGHERGGVVDRIAALAAPVRDDLSARKEQGAIVEWSSQRANIWADRPWNSDGKRLALVHHASVEITATFRDFAALSWWISDVAERDGVQVDGVAWRLTPATAKAIEADAAAQAVRVAVERATAYASAVGLTDVSPVEIADLGLLQGAHDAVAPSPMMMRAMAIDGVGGAPAVQFQPEDVVVRAAVQARFAAR